MKSHQQVQISEFPGKKLKLLKYIHLKPPTTNFSKQKRGKVQVCIKKITDMTVQVEIQFQFIFYLTLVSSTFGLLSGVCYIFPSF